MRVPSLSTFVLLTSLFVGIVSLEPISPNQEQREVLRDTMKVLLDFEQIPEEDVLLPLSRTPHTVSRYMKKLYEQYENGDNEDGNVVRSILPRVGKFNGEDALVYDFEHIRKQEKIMRAELHFNLRIAQTNKRRARSVKALVKCSHSYCTEDYALPPMHIDVSSISFDATLPLAHLHSLNSTQMVVKIWRKDIQMRPYPVLIRRNAPFLIVFTESGERLDGSKVGKMTTERNRVRAKRQNDFFTYSAHNEVTEMSKERGSNEELGKRGSSILRRKKLKSHINRRLKEKKNDPWYGFGEKMETTTEGNNIDEDDEDEDGRTQITESNGLSMVLNGEGKQKLCSKFSFLIDFANIGWDDHVVAPKSFDGGYCGGGCPFPLPQKTRPSNHALLYSLLFPLGVSKVCCAPDNMETLNVLYFDQLHNLVLRSFSKMIVKSCSCM